MGSFQFYGTYFVSKKLVQIFEILYYLVCEGIHGVTSYFLYVNVYYAKQDQEADKDKATAAKKVSLISVEV